MGRVTEIGEDLCPYYRIGHINLGRFCDWCVALFSKNIPGETLDSYWSFRYSDLSGVKWGRSKHYHTLIVDSKVIARVWTVVSKQEVVCEVCDELAEKLQLRVYDIPTNSLERSKPLTKRVFLVSEVTAKHVVSTIKKEFNI